MNAWRNRAWWERQNQGEREGGKALDCESDEKTTRAPPL